MSDFLQNLKKSVLLGDGAMGTMLVKEGLPPGHNPELWMLENPQSVMKIHKAYLEAGSQVIQTNTFGANRLKLSEYQAADRVKEINITAARLVRESVSGKAFVAGIVGPSGHFPSPLGDMSWQELVEVFTEQVTSLEKGGVDFIFLETFSDLGEIRAALFAAKQFTKLPVACSLTYEKGRTLTGTSPQVAALVLSSMGADIIGANCSTGPAQLLAVMEEYRQATELPLLVEPNAGMPEFINGKTIYRESPQHMAEFMEPFRQIGVNLIGACCGSTPEHIKFMAQGLSSRNPGPQKSAIPSNSTGLASRSKIVFMGSPNLPQVIGERINPSARKAIAQALREENWDFIIQEGINQLDAGAQLLDLNVGVPGADEGQYLSQGVRHLQMALDIPLVLDSTRPEALEKGLQEFHGKALINSVNGEQKSLETILPLAVKYGAAVLGLTLDDEGIPEKAEARLEIARRIVEKAQSYGLAKEDVFIDCLVLTAATSPDLAQETLRAISLVKEQLGVPTVLGLSNVSHGLPQRSWLNSTFLALALGAGLDAAIANPQDQRIMETVAAGALLTGRDSGAKNYLEKAGTNPPVLNNPALEKSEDISLDSLQNLILHGQQEPLITLLTKLLERNEVLTIINGGITPALEKMGEDFAQGKAYLPQLMMAGDAAKKAFEFLKSYLPEDSAGHKGIIVLGTVKGDVHDIGKNIVGALLENHGYKVIDLGKNVNSQAFKEAAKNENAQIIGLSALMTTTMVEMESIISEIKEELPDVKFMVGGAVVTPEYAHQIGAHGYGQDAVAALKTVQSLLGTT